MVRHARQRRSETETGPVTNLKETRVMISINDDEICICLLPTFERMKSRKRTHRDDDGILMLEPATKKRRVLVSPPGKNILNGSSFELFGKLESSSASPPSGIECAKCNRILCNLTTIQENHSHSSYWVQKVTNDEKPEFVPRKERRPCQNCLSPHKIFYSNKKKPKKRKKALSPNYRKRVDFQRRTAPVPWSFLAMTQNANIKGKRAIKASLV